MLIAYSEDTRSFQSRVKCIHERLEDGAKEEMESCCLRSPRLRANHSFEYISQQIRCPEFHLRIANEMLPRLTNRLSLV